jgi:uncharacterized protein YecT (DUF1311 family)
MKSLSLKVIFSAILVVSGGAAVAQSQTDMNADAGTEYAKADAELNRVYRKILVEYKADPQFLSKLKDSQRVWISFRDAEINAIFPSANKDDYGSVYPMCRSNWLATLTSQRTKELHRWLDGVEEGDVCCGSIRIK